MESERKAQEEEAARVRAEMERIAQQEYDERIAMMWEDQHSREAKRYWLRVEAAARRKVEEAERAREAWERDLMEAEEDESTMYEAWMKVKAKEIADAKRAEERARQRAQERARQRKELMAMSIADEESTKENDQYKLIEEERRAAAELERQRMLQLQEELKVSLGWRDVGEMRFCNWCLFCLCLCMDAAATAKRGGRGSCGSRVSSKGLEAAGVH